MFLLGERERERDYVLKSYSLMIAILMQVESLSKYFFNFEILKPRNDVP